MKIPANNKKDDYKGKDIRFQDINYKFLIRFETQHYKNGNMANGLSYYMRGIRAIYNKAILAGLVAEEAYPFKKYKIKKRTNSTTRFGLGMAEKNC